MDMEFRFLRFIGSMVFLVLIYLALYKIYIPRINAFGCFDDCFNYVGGYFLGQGKKLYSQIYFNHMPLMAYISAVVQHFGNPINIYALVLQHRQILLVFSFVSNLFIVWRFGLVGISFTVLYEFSKFYVFGDRFLAEGFIVYPLVYMTGLVLFMVAKKPFHYIEIMLASIMTWFVMFMREPYIALVLFLYGAVIFQVKSRKIRMFAIGLFIVPTIMMFTLFPVQDFFYNVITVNVQRALTNELRANNFIGTDLLKSFFYPVYLLFDGFWNSFRIQLIFLSLVMGYSLYVWIKRKKSFVTLLFLISVLGLSNLRPTQPGQQYYEAFHMINWFGLFIFTTFYLFRESIRDGYTSFIYSLVAGVITLYVLANPASHIFQKADEHTEFIINYGTLLQMGEVIKAISSPGQTLFTEGADELLYLVTKMNSSYPYSFYYSAGEKYSRARLRMFALYPPDIYYDFCTPEAPIYPSIPVSSKPLYAQWYSEDKPTCLHMKRTLAALLTDQQRAKAREFLYYLPER